MSEIVVASGGSSNSTEILNLETLTWRGTQSDFPRGRVLHGRTVQRENTILAIGGYSKDIRNTSRNLLRDIYVYNVEKDIWQKLDAQLQTGRCLHTVIAVPKSFCQQ